MVIKGMKERLEQGSEKMTDFKYIEVNICMSMRMEKEKYMDGISVPGKKGYFGERKMMDGELVI